MVQRDRMSSAELRASIGLAGIFGLRLLGMFVILPVFAIYAERVVTTLPWSGSPSGHTDSPRRFCRFLSAGGPTVTAASRRSMRVWQYSLPAASLPPRLPTSAS
jgi:hypothetical protein